MHIQSCEYCDVRIRRLPTTYGIHNYYMNELTMYIRTYVYCTLHITSSVVLSFDVRIVAFAD